MTSRAFIEQARIRALEALRFTPERGRRTIGRLRHGDRVCALGLMAETLGVAISGQASTENELEIVLDGCPSWVWGMNDELVPDRRKRAWTWSQIADKLERYWKERDAGAREPTGMEVRDW